MPRSIEGQGVLTTAKPPRSAPTGWPSMFTTSAAIPKKGRVAEPGLRGVLGTGAIMMAPVSVCHQVSMIGHSSRPATWRYHIQASGLMGSPTEPSSRIVDKSYLPGHSSPKRIRPRMAVGAQYRMLALYFWMMLHHTPGSG